MFDSLGWHLEIFRISITRKCFTHCFIFHRMFPASCSFSLVLREEYIDVQIAWNCKQQTDGNPKISAQKYNMITFKQMWKCKVSKLKALICALHDWQLEKLHSLLNGMEVWKMWQKRPLQIRMSTSNPQWTFQKITSQSMYHK